MLVDKSVRSTLGVTKQDVYYSDFLDDLNVHPSTGLLSRVLNENSVKQSIKNIVMTSNGERPFQPLIGGGVRRLLFNPMDGFTADDLKNEIIRTIINNEPRVSAVDAVVTPDEPNNTYLVSITFSLKTVQTTSTLEITLQRVR